MYGKTHLELKPERLRRNVGMCGGKDGKILLELKRVASDENDKDRNPTFTDCWVSFVLLFLLVENVVCPKENLDAFKRFRVGICEESRAEKFAFIDMLSSLIQFFRTSVGCGELNCKTSSKKASDYNMSTVLRARQDKELQQYGGKQRFNSTASGFHSNSEHLFIETDRSIDFEVSESE
ncbi:unnamed protein product [Angiostrongylus costaricensis]|uniref:FH2 domain-containing protein n=1 Tax=Angiostrongylus costaricensis TaxID=334426 RepID=A0A0R3PLM9_ANGCS|nr:unnamed protein product [Angiostrongylus costaricensis]